MNLINKISNSFTQYAKLPAFCINSEFYTYEDCAKRISGVRKLISQHISSTEKKVGLFVSNDIETYISIFALWMEGKAYIPLQYDTPIQRNEFILDSTDTKTILSKRIASEYERKCNVLSTHKITSKNATVTPSKVSVTDLAYILFTSGSTGTPKGVPIDFGNLFALYEAMDADEKHRVFSNDRCLQMFELTFDYSLVTFLYPILNGACVYTVSKDKITYLAVYELILKEQLNYLVMTPSIINYLRPYFNEINADFVRYSCFGAAPLDVNLINEWRTCVPNASLFNSYGPTENTVTSSYYFLDGIENIQNNNGIVAVGNFLKGITAIVIDEDNNILKTDTEGELCLAGNQLTRGYWKNEAKNKESFFEKTIEGKKLRFYKTGDLGYLDKEERFIFIGRKDFQVKIRGYRVELSEIEFHAKSKLDKNLNLAVVDVVNELGNMELGLVIESEPFDTSEIFSYMKEKMPSYMIPTQLRFTNKFYYTRNEKIDRKELKKVFK